MSEPFIGQIEMFAANFPPRGWAFCDGQLLAIQQNQAVFALLGTNYGGNGQTTFALPDLRSRLPVHQGTGPGLSPYPIGSASGSPTVTVDLNSMPTHTHTLNVTTADATQPSIDASVLPGTPTASGAYAYAVPLTSPNPALAMQTMAAGTCGFNGGSQAHTNLMPSLCVSFIIALQGLFPSRN